MGGAWDTEKGGFIAEGDLISGSGQLGGAREIEREQRIRDINERNTARSTHGLSGSGQLGGA